MAFVESFNGRFRDTCLNEHWFTSIQEARRVIAAWRRHYNTEWPHSSLGYLTPRDYSEKAGAPELRNGSARRLVPASNTMISTHGLTP